MTVKQLQTKKKNILAQIKDYQSMIDSPLFNFTEDQKTKIYAKLDKLHYSLESVENEIFARRQRRWY